jgi:hypothetical protein
VAQQLWLLVGEIQEVALEIVRLRVLALLRGEDDGLL